MYGLGNRAWPQRTTIFVVECMMLVFVYWFLFMKGNVRFGLPDGDEYRKLMLFGACIFTFIRMGFMIVYLLRRGVTWGETGGVLFAFAAYYIGFAMMGGIQDKPVDWLDGVAILLFIGGSAVNTLSEWLRDQWKKDEGNRGKLYTGGLFRYAIHINYFGDIVWVTGFAWLTRNVWSGLLPFMLLLMFILKIFRCMIAI